MIISAIGVGTGILVDLDSLHELGATSVSP